MIFAEVEHRRKRALFDSFISHHIEYQPYINSIYTLCYPTGSIQVAKPPVGWIRAEAIRDKYYLDEVFFYLHMVVMMIVMIIVIMIMVILISLTHLIKINSILISNNIKNVMEIIIIIM